MIGYYKLGEDIVKLLPKESVDIGNNIYEICLAEVKVKSTTNIAETDIVDKRLNTDLCGIVNSLISVNGEELYTKFEEYIDTVTENLVRKDQDIVINGNIIATTIKQSDGKTFSSNDFTNAYKSKLDGISNKANNYSHPATHPASIISESSSRRFVSDGEKNTWNGKQKAISRGTGNPSGGSNGDIYIQYYINLNRLEYKGQSR